MNEVITEKDELRPEYDLNTLLDGGVRGKYAAQYQEGTNLVLLAPDVAAAFSSAEAVNEALRLVLRIARIPTTTG
ncbi:MAG: hypothetical protein GY832_03935 [Chloroflexi bacterium]|nr:hypothetical protein [Chloroflexota bacterium]